MKVTSELKLEQDPSVNEIIDESSGNSFIALRKLRWNNHSEFKLDIRKWYTSSTGEEVAGKGVSFMTDDGPSNLIQALLNLGYGDTIKTLRGVKDRDDFLISLAYVLSRPDINKVMEYMDGKEDTAESYYDPKNIFD